MTDDTDKKIIMALEEGIPVNEISRKTNIPKKTIWNRIEGKVANKQKFGKAWQINKNRKEATISNIFDS